MIALIFSSFLLAAIPVNVKQEHNANRCLKDTLFFSEQAYEEGPFTTGCTDKEKKYHGLIRKFSYAGKLISEINYDHGSKKGTMKLFFENGELKSLENWSNDFERYGNQSYYFRNGRLFQHQIINQKRYTEAAKVIYSTNYHFDTISDFDGERINGYQVTFWGNGQIKSLKNYSDFGTERMSPWYFNAEGVSENKKRLPSPIQIETDDGLFQMVFQGQYLSSVLMIKNNVVVYSQKFDKGIATGEFYRKDISDNFIFKGTYDNGKLLKARSFEDKFLKACGCNRNEGVEVRYRFEYDQFRIIDRGVWVNKYKLKKYEEYYDKNKNLIGSNAYRPILTAENREKVDKNVPGNMDALLDIVHYVPEDP